MKRIPNLILTLFLTSTVLPLLAQEVPAPTSAAPTATETAPVKVPKQGPFRGTISEVDAAGGKFIISNKAKSKVKTYTLSKETRLTRGDAAITLADVKVGEYVRGSCLKDGSDTYQVFSAKVGEKTEEEKAEDAKKKAEKEAKPE